MILILNRRIPFLAVSMTNLFIYLHIFHSAMISQLTMPLDGDYLLVPIVTNSSICLNTYSGYARWKESSSESMYISSPRMSEDGKFVYTIQASLQRDFSIVD